MSQLNYNEKLFNILNNYSVILEDELKHRWNNWEIDITKKEIYEVVAGLLTRQIIIMKHLIKSPFMWNPDLGPIILRSLVDNFFNLSWICDDPLDRSRKYIYHGLGVDKLNMENRKKQLEEDGENHVDDPLVKLSDAWAESQRYRFLTEVDFGSWSGISTRKMAEDSGNLGLYNYIFQPFSSVAHNMWNHIGKYCMKQSSNPFHQLIHIPEIKEYPPMLFVLEIAANYLSRSFERVDKLFPLPEEIRSGYEYFQIEINKLNTEEEEE